MPMNTFYMMLIAVISVIVNIIITMVMPYAKQAFNRIIDTIKTELRKKRYYSKQSESAKIKELEDRIVDLETKINKRFNNDRTYIQEQIKSVLLKLKEKQ